MYYTPDSPSGTDLDQFCEVFRKLVKDKVKSVDYCGLGVVTITFKDGTECGAMVPWFRSGLIDGKEFVERFCKQ
jgi:hypothetical protein